MPRKEGREYERIKPGIGLNSVLKNEAYGWKKKNCAKRQCEEWLPDRNAIPETKRPKDIGTDEGWEQKVFDFFEPFYLSGCLNDLRGGGKQATFGSHGPQLDAIFNFYAWRPDFSDIAKYIALCEAKNCSNHQDGYERALSQLHERDMSIRTSETDAIILPLILLKGERQGLKEPAETHLHEVHKRSSVIWENDIDFYVTQARDLGWKRAWKLFMYEILHIQAGTKEILSFPAIRYKVKTKFAYSVYLPSNYAVDICHVERARKKAPHGLYQRPLQISRLREISADLMDSSSLNTCFPNSIVSSIDSSTANRLPSPIWSESVSDNICNSSTIGVLQLPNIYGLLRIIDGQHRVFAHGLLSPELQQQYGLPFTIVENILPREEMVLFKSINTTAEEVNANLVDIILYSMRDLETDRGLAASAVCTLAFEDKEWQDFFDHLGTGISDFDFGKRGIRIKIDNMVQPLIRSGYDLIRDKNKGFLNPSNIDDKLQYVTTIIKDYFSQLCDKFKYNNYDFWYKYIRTRSGMRLSLLLLAFWIKKQRLTGNALDSLNLDDLVEQVYSNRKIIRDEFENTKGTGRGDEFIQTLAERILTE